MSKFKVGDRVVSYGHLGLIKGTVSDITVEGLDSRIVIDCDAGDYQQLAVYPQQCRKLVKSKPRRRIWVPNADAPGGLVTYRFDSLQEMNSYLDTEAEGSPIFTEFVEVKRRGSK